MIVFAVVLYKKRMDESTTVQSLLRCLESFAALDYRVLVLDNSEHPPGQQPVSELVGDKWALHAFGSNVGLARAYNVALKFSRDCAPRYMVTLDQDSVVTTAYIEAVIAALPRMVGQTVALCPGIRSAGRIVSPFIFNRLGMPSYGAARGKLFAINSFSVYSTAYLSSVGGFDEHYWLDGLDFAIFAQIHRRGCAVGRLDVIVEHDLSLLSGAMSEWRFANVVWFEACFLAEYCGPLHALAGFARLFARVLASGRHGLGPGTIVRGLGKMVRGAVAGWRRRPAAYRPNVMEKLD